MADRPIEIAVAVPLRQIERMMCDDDPHRVRRRGHQPSGRARHLSLAQPAAAVKRQRPRAVQADHDHLRRPENTGSRSSVM